MINKHGVDVSKIKVGDLVMVKVIEMFPSAPHPVRTTYFNKPDDIYAHTPAPLKAGDRATWGGDVEVEILAIYKDIAWTKLEPDRLRTVHLSELTPIQ